MEDSKIVERYWQRDEQAIKLTEEKYGRYLLKIAFNILQDPADSDECVNDTYLKAWNSMPQNRPSVLSTYLGKITRRLSVDVFRKKNADKRAASQYAISLDELDEIIGGNDITVGKAEVDALAAAISTFLKGTSSVVRTAFVCRYYFSDSLEDISLYSGMSVPKIKSLLFRTRKELREYLLKEGFDL